MNPSKTQLLLETLQARFDGNMQRHKGLRWADVLPRIAAKADAMSSLEAMESSGGEPDVVAWDKKTGQYVFCDCSIESPIGRRSLCYDRKALDSRKENKPKGSALELAAAIGVELLSEEQYRHLQELGDFDLKTSSWVATPDDVRNLGGALFCDRRFARVFVYHNGAESYYAARGFRGQLYV